MATKRLLYLDNLRVALTMLLIAHHVGQAYGPTGGDWPIQEALRAPVLGPFFTVNRSFFMSLFFMIAGYFTVMSCDSNGPRRFLKNRLLRLGLPVLAMGLLMIPLKLFVFHSPSILPIEVGHLWFLEHLLIFGACYALWRMLRPAPAPASPVEANPPGYLPILAFALALAVVLMVVRIFFHIDQWTYLLGFIRVAFADLPRDLAFYIIGLVAYRKQWFSSFSTRAGYTWLAVGLVAAGLWYGYALLVYKSLLPYNDTAMGIIYPIWEMILCCGMCIGLTVLFREMLDFQGRIARAMGQSQYAAYIFHLFGVLLFQFAVLSLDLPPLVKFILVTLVSIPATFLFSNWVRKPLHL